MAPYMRPFSVYDTVMICERRTYLFSNPRIGHLEDTSMQVPGQLSSDEIVYWQDLSLRVVGVSREKELQILDRIVVFPMWGDKEQGSYAGSLLVETNPARIFRDFTVPVRQNVAVSIDNYYNEPFRLRATILGRGGRPVL